MSTAVVTTAAETVSGSSPGGLVFDRTDELAAAAHEQVVFCHDRATGLRAIIAIHDTTLGPALGGTRIKAYASEAEAVTDVLRLSQGMTAKSAAAGMDLGGGKAVIIGDPATVKTPALLRAYGRFVDSLGGRYVTAADIGSTADDLDIVAEATRWVVGKNKGGSGDSGYSTAYGVFCAMRAAAERRFGPEGLAGRTVGVEGVGKVGARLVSLLAAAGVERILVADPDATATAALAANLAHVEVVGSVIDAEVDVYAPCALGATLTPQSVELLRAPVVCGAANNQLLTHDVADLMHARGVLWVPDYVANAGGVVQVGGELYGHSHEEVEAKIAAIGHTTEEILRTAEDLGITTSAAADAVVEARLAARRAEIGAQESAR
ncbi:Glu/Leu/Phe/Val dehydrogenase dimerization domain-containing protein [Nocardioides jiangxiensis]|uniref:Glu/Leu/Phe/Val dehydrogenase dimerization domain-containing protein n=1 Tax=Nocardioides jiangxiensis TaxID=3064524 RepID=A0ABT9AXQ2_9ACTN|nr:Glu/Leu/Phe/Val dehydrogenase dimerization domain-containing protein [Nocardioides sp. WY-20]MDO7867068.1 Glu/Leu/Phe/Val dehydrogenase dimerization domain-containing protein [Nocardioides sp. WY-20]